MYPNNPQPNTQPEPQQPIPTQPPVPPVEPQPAQAPVVEPVQFQPPRPVSPEPAPVMQAPVADNSFSAPVPQQSSNKILSLLNEKAGILSLIAFAVGFVILALATVFKINDALNTLSSLGSQYQSTFTIPSLFDATKDVITNWVFVIVVSAPWWILGLAPAVLLAVYSLVKQGVRNVPAMITLALSLAVFINIIVK